MGPTEVLPQEIKDIGFSVVDSVSLLGQNITNKPSDFPLNFTLILEKIKKQIIFWKRFNLSLPGRISISKSLLVSQINYLGAICFPNPIALAQMQSTIDSFCLGNTRVAKDRLYTSPSRGGAVLINISDFLYSQQATWVLKANNAIRDNWQFDLFLLSNKNILSITPVDVNKTLHPVLFTIVEAYSKVKGALESKSTNFRTATILNNPIFKRGPRDRLLLDYDFFFSLCTTPAFPLIAKINFTDLFVGNRFKTIGQLELLFNTTLNNEFFLVFRNAFNYFKISHRKELNSTETPIPMSHYCTIKKPGKQFRL